MAEDDVFIREVDEDLAQARQLATLRKYAPFFIVTLLGVIGIIGGREFLQNRNEKIAQESATAYAHAQTLAKDDPASGRLAFETLYKTGPVGYGTLAALHSASIAAQNDERESAIITLTDLAADTTRATHLRNLARVRAGYLSITDGTSAVSSILNGLEHTNTPFGYYAKEALALAALEEKDFARALVLFTALENTIGVPQPIQDRATELGATAYLGTKGITPQLSVDSVSPKAVIDAFAGGSNSSADAVLGDHNAESRQTDELTEHD